MGGVSWWAIVAIWEHACTDQDSLQLVSCTHSCIKFTKVKLYDKAPWRFTSSSQVNGDKDGCMHGGRGFMMRCDSWCRCRSDKCVWEVVFFSLECNQNNYNENNCFFFIMSCKKDPALFWGSPVSLLHSFITFYSEVMISMLPSCPALLVPPVWCRLYLHCHYILWCWSTAGSFHWKRLQTASDVKQAKHWVVTNNIWQTEQIHVF